MRAHKSHENEKTVLLTAVHYDDAEQVLAFARHVTGLSRPDGWRIALAIADNSQTWNAATPALSDVTVFTPGANLGYLSGCAYAFEQWQSQYGELPDWTAVVNTDMELCATFFTDLLGHELPEDTGLIAPGTHLPDGAPQNPFLRTRPNRLRMFWSTIAYRNMALMSFMLAVYRTRRRVMRWARGGRPASSAGIADGAPVRIYAAHGSSMFLYRAFFERGGTLRYRGFMYGEEIHIAEQCRKLGLGVYWLPSLDVLHQAHATTGGIARVRRRKWLHESARIAWEDYFCR